MLKALRKKGVAKKIFIVLAIVIVPAFVLWGSASLLRSQRYSYAGKIFGKKISFDDFQESLRAVQTQGLLQFGENFYKIQRFLNLELEAWDRLILLHEAKKRKVRVSDQEVVEDINRIPFFQRNGRFDQKTYQDMLEFAFKIPPRFFEEQIRQQLILNKLYGQITEDISVSETELLAAYKKGNEKVKVSYAFISPADFEKGISVEENETKEYFNSHRQEFKEPPAINIQYLGFLYPQEITEEGKKQLQEKLMEVYSQLQRKEPLEKVAKLNNIAVKETGFFSLEKQIPAGVPFEVIQTALILKDEQFSNPVLAASGCFIVRIKEKKGAYLPDFNAAKPQVEKRLIQQRARKLAEDKASQLAEKIDLKTKDFKAWAAEFDLKVNQTPLFKLGEYLPQIGLSAEFQNAAFELMDKKEIRRVATPQGFYLMKWDEFVPIDEQKFNREKEGFKAKLLEQKKNESFNRFFENLKKKANLQDNVSRMQVGQ